MSEAYFLTFYSVSTWVELGVALGVVISGSELCPESGVGVGTGVGFGVGVGTGVTGV